MITLIEIDGFKTFKDFKVELAPFQVIVGPNGSGKSNLFDALHLLSRLAELDLRSAFQDLRGDPNELFTMGTHENRIRFAVEMLVDHKVRDRLGIEVELKDTRLRYELEITKYISENGLEGLRITNEALKTIAAEQDHWANKYKAHSLAENSRNLINTISIPPAATRNINDLEASMTPTIRLYSDDGEKPVRHIVAERAEGTVLSSITNTEYQHAFAAREELRSWRFLHLNPEVLRQSSSTQATRFLSPEGKNLPTTLARMQAEDKFALTDVSRDMANLVRGIFKISVEHDKASDKYVIYAETSDQRTFSAQVLSDGTLRLLALATLRNDPQFHGTLCLEEPENGVHPQRLKNLAHLLRKMATNFNDSDEVDEPLRQVLITTHSPTFISLPEVIDSLLFAYTMTRVEPLESGDPTLEITCMTPVVTPGTQTQFRMDIQRDETMEVYTLDEVLRYLDSEDLDKARKQLREARTTLNEL